MKPLHPCHILLLRGKLQVLPTLEGRDYQTWASVRLLKWLKKKKYHRLVAYDNRNLILTLLEAENSKSKVCGESLLLGLWMAVFFVCVYMMEGTRELSGASSVRALIPFVKSPSLCFNPLPEVPPPKTIPLVVRF